MSIRIEKNGSDQPCYHFFFFAIFFYKNACRFQNISFGRNVLWTCVLVYV